MSTNDTTPETNTQQHPTPEGQTGQSDVTADTKKVYPSEEKRKTRKSNIGRPTKLNKRFAKRFCKLIEKGVPVRSACQIMGIGTVSVYNWRNSGYADIEEGRPDTVFAFFAILYERSQGLQVKNRVERISKAAEGGQVVHTKTTLKSNGDEVTESKYTAPQWTADAWWLERQYPDEFGKRQTIEHAGQVQNMNINVVAQLPESELLALSRVLGSTKPKVIEATPVETRDQS